MGAFTNMQRVLDTRLKAVASNPYISWPNTNIKPGNAQLSEYVKPNLLLASTELHTINDYERIPGIYQVDIYTQANRGVASLHNLADEIKAHFYSQRELRQDDTIVLIQGISLGPEAREGSWYRSFLEINFICYNNTD